MIVSGTEVCYAGSTNWLAKGTYREKIMGDGATSFLWNQLGYQLPALIVYFAAFVLALVFSTRATAPSLLALSGAMILVLTTICVALLQAYLIESRDYDQRTAELINLSGKVGAYLRAIGLSLLVAAVFVGRRRPDRGLQASPIKTVKPFRELEIADPSP